MRPRDDYAPRHRRPRRRRDRRAATLLAGVVLLGTGGAATPLLTAGEAEPAPRPSDVAVVAEASAGTASVAITPSDSPAVRAVRTVPVARGPVVRAATVLRAWDARRARAWAEGDVRGLRRLYVDGAGAADVRLLRRYAERGYRVEGMTTQLLAVEVVGRAPDRWRLRVTDRLADAVARRGHERLRLPRDRADTHLITLVRGEDGRWRVARARPV